MTCAPYEIKNNTAIFNLQFDFDLYNAKEFKEYAIKTITENQFNKVIINFAGVNYFDSSGIGAIVHILQKTTGQVKLRLCCLQEGVMKVLKLTNLERLFQIDKTEEECLNKING